MFNRILIRMREKVRINEYIMTFHARKEMINDGFSIFDVESGILTGELLERQRDHSSAEWKYRINGKTIDDSQIELLCNN